jgi:hypothetical protein
MITNFKIFEEVFTEQVYWRIEPKSEEYILASLKKIGVNIELYDNVKKNEVYFMIKNHRPIYVARGYDKGDKVNWFFYSYSFQEFKNDKMKFMGALKLTKKDIEEFRLTSQMDKYNL